MVAQFLQVIRCFPVSQLTITLYERLNDRQLLIAIETRVDPAYL